MDNSIVISEILFILMIVVSPFFIFLLAIILKRYNKKNKKRSVFTSLVNFALELFSVIFLFLVKIFSFLFVGNTKYVDDMKEEIDQYFYKDDDVKDKNK